MKLRLAYYGDSILRKKATPIAEINDAIRQLVADMVETMDAHNGCGLAAPQVHQSIRLFITCIPEYIEDKEEKSGYKMIPGPLRVFINPKIIAYSDECQTDDEGCLSIPDLRGEVTRPLKITIEATDLEGNTFTEDFVEFEARAIMHENDHINGVLYIDRLSPKRKKEFEAPLREIKRKYSK
jgi:peptide deformylase